MNYPRFSSLLIVFFILAFNGCKGPDDEKPAAQPPKIADPVVSEKKETEDGPVKSEPIPPELFGDDDPFGVADIAPSLDTQTLDKPEPVSEPAPHVTPPTTKTEPKQPTAEEGFAARAAEKPRQGDVLKLTPGLSERDILNKMVQEYKAAESYGDHGQFIVEWADGKTQPVAWPCTFAYSKPNLIRMEITDGKMVSDGQMFYALIPQLFGQVLKIPAPNKLSIGALYPDMNLSGAMDLRIPGDLFWVPPQILLLFAKDPLKTLVPEGAKVSFGKPTWLDDIPCDRIAIENSSGARTFWIDRETFALMRVELPVDRLPAVEGQRISKFRLELENASLNPELEGETFTIEYPESARLVENFAQWSVKIQGEKLDKFDSITINSFAGASLPLSQYKDKVVVLQFWSAVDSNCAEAMREAFAAYQKMKDDQRVRFIGVCLDPEQNVSTEDATKALTDWQARLPSCRLPDFQLPESLWLNFAPNLVILAPGGVVARYFPPGANSEQEILDAIQEVLDGKIVDPSLAGALEKEREDYGRTIQAFIDSDYYAVSSGLSPFEENVEIAPRKLPSSLKLAERAVVSELKNPGNILVVPREAEGKEPLFLVPYEKNLLALFDADGKVVNRIRPQSVLSSESISVVRTALDSRGKRIYVASAPITNGGNRIHILDEQFESLGFYPSTQADADALVITDVRLIDLDDDRDPEIVISALDISKSVVGSGFVRAVKLDGTVLWENTKIASPYHLGIALSENKPSILAMNATSQNMTLFEFDPQGNQKREISLKDNNPIGWFVVEDLDGSGDSRICASIPHKGEKNTVHIAEIDRSGNQDWQYPFLVAAHTIPLEYMIAADIIGDATKEWIFASADGELHFLDAAGKPLDRYSHGKIITGFSAAPIAGKKILAVADPESITIYEVER